MKSGLRTFQKNHEYLLLDVLDRYDLIINMSLLFEIKRNTAEGINHVIYFLSIRIIHTSTIINKSETIYISIDKNVFDFNII